MVSQRHSRVQLHWHLLLHSRGNQSLSHGSFQVVALDALIPKVKADMFAGCSAAADLPAHDDMDDFAILISVLLNLHFGVGTEFEVDGTCGDIICVATPQTLLATSSTLIIGGLDVAGTASLLHYNLLAGPRCGSAMLTQGQRSVGHTTNRAMSSEQ